MNIAELIQGRSNTFCDDFSFIGSTAILFIYTGWSGPAHVAMNLLFQSLHYFPDLKLYILDVDKKETFNYMIERDILSHGWGETYWMKNGEMIAIVKRYGFNSQEELVVNHRMLE